MLVEEILALSGRKDLIESGGGHGQKGVDFQRYWALMRLLEVEEAAPTDFLFIFETFADVAELDSTSHPSSIRIVQVKKKDRGEWTWSELTGLGGRQKKGQSAVDRFRLSPIGKLCATLTAFKALNVSGAFVSNMGCNVDLETAGNAATTARCHLLLVAKSERTKLQEVVSALAHPSPPFDLKNIELTCVPLPPNDPDTYVVGLVHKFLLRRNPRHANQAKALVDALVTRLSSLGRHTDACVTFDELKRQRGYCRADFLGDIGTIDRLPDIVVLIDDWIEQLRTEGMSTMEITRLRLEISTLSQRQLVSPRTPDSVDAACMSWVGKNPANGSLRTWLEAACLELCKTTAASPSAIRAHVLFEAVKLCAAPA